MSFKSSSAMCRRSWTPPRRNPRKRTTASPNWKKKRTPLLALYNLQQEYAAGNLDGCRVTLQEISDQGLEELLPKTAPDGITSPAQRYQQLPGGHSQRLTH